MNSGLVRVITMIEQEITTAAKQVVRCGELVKRAKFGKDLVAIHVFSDSGIC